MPFRCCASNRTPKLLGWVKDGFQHCAPAWDRGAENLQEHETVRGKLDEKNHKVGSRTRLSN